MSRKRNRRYHPKATGNALGFVLAISQPHSAADVAELMNVTDLALVRMLDGTAEPMHFARLAWDINLVGVRAEQIGGVNADVLALIASAGEALEHAEEIRQQHGRYGLTGPGRRHLQAGVDAYRAILEASSPRQMADAETELERRQKAHAQTS